MVELPRDEEKRPDEVADSLRVGALGPPPDPFEEAFAALAVADRQQPQRRQRRQRRAPPRAGAAAAAAAGPPRAARAARARRSPTRAARAAAAASRAAATSAASARGGARRPAGRAAAPGTWPPSLARRPRARRSPAAVARSRRAPARRLAFWARGRASGARLAGAGALRARRCTAALLAAARFAASSAASAASPLDSSVMSSAPSHVPGISDQACVGVRGALPCTLSTRPAATGFGRCSVLLRVFSHESLPVGAMRILCSTVSYNAKATGKKTATFFACQAGTSYLTLYLGTLYLLAALAITQIDHKSASIF